MKTQNSNTHIYSSIEDMEKKETERFESVQDNDITELTEGDDAIEIENETGDKIIYGSTFSPADGDVGDESEDNGDLPEGLRGKPEYTPTLASGAASDSDFQLDENRMHITDENHIGLGFDDNDYTEGKV